MKSAAVWLAAVAMVWGQDRPLLDSRAAIDKLAQVARTMETAAAAAPDLARAAAPLVETAKKLAANMRTTGAGQNSVLTYDFVSNLRAFLALAETFPRTAVLSDENRRQLSELHEAEWALETHLRALMDLRERQVRSSDRDNLRRYADENKSLGAPVAGSPRVIFFGDSITDFWHLKEYFPDRDFVNRGISGQITGEMLGRVKADVVDLKPAAVLVLAGTNDLARGIPVSTISNNIVMIADLVSSYRIKVLLASILPVNDYHQSDNPLYARTSQRPPALIRELNAWMAQFAKQRGYVYVNYFDRMVDPVGFLKAELCDDGLHPNAAGYKVMAPIALANIDATVPPGGRRRKPKQ